MRFKRLFFNRYFKQSTLNDAMHKCRFYCSSCQSKVSIGECFNFYAFTFTFWLYIGRLGTWTDRKTSESELHVRALGQNFLCRVRPTISFKTFRSLQIVEGWGGGQHHYVYMR